MTRLKLVLALVTGMFLLQAQQASHAFQFQLQHLAEQIGSTNKILVHSWDEMERKHRYPSIGNTNRFRREGLSWRQFKYKYRKQIRKFARNNNLNFAPGNEAYYFYNYNFGYLTDNCEFIRGPVRFCWYDDQRDKRKCRWRHKWRYKCY